MSDILSQHALVYVYRVQVFHVMDWLHVTGVHAIGWLQNTFLVNAADVILQREKKQIN